MRYYAQYSEDSKLLAIGIGSGGTEITESEYNALLSEILEKADLVNKLYSGEITIDEIPADWREEIQRRVNERIAANGEESEQDISGDELMSMMEAVL